MVPNIARLCAAARARGVRVIHCTAIRRADALGANKNARIFQYMAKAEPKLIPGSAAAEIVPEIAVAESDLVLARIHGLSPFQGTELDFVLRNEGIRTIVGVGVSVNVAITNLTFDAVNAGYQVVLPRDAIAGTPREYAEQVFQHTLRQRRDARDDRRGARGVAMSERHFAARRRRAKSNSGLCAAERPEPRTEGTTR